MWDRSGFIPAVSMDLVSSPGARILRSLAFPPTMKLHGAQFCFPRNVSWTLSPPSSLTSYSRRDPSHHHSKIKWCVFLSSSGAGGASAQNCLALKVQNVASFSSLATYSSGAHPNPSVFVCCCCFNIYLFVCIRSQLPHTGSSLFHVGSFSTCGTWT